MAIPDDYRIEDFLRDDAIKMLSEGGRVLEYLKNAIDRSCSTSAVCFPTLNGFATKYRDDGNFYNDRGELKFPLRAYFVSALSIASNARRDVRSSGALCLLALLKWPVSKEFRETGSFLLQFILSED